MNFQFLKYRTGWDNEWSQENGSIVLDGHAPSVIVLKAQEAGTVQVRSEIKAGGRGVALPFLNGQPINYDENKLVELQSGETLTLEARLEGDKNQCWNLWKIEGASIVLRNPLAISFWEGAHLGDSLGMLIACENFARANDILLPVRTTPLFQAIYDLFKFEHLHLVPTESAMLYLHPFGKDFEHLGWVGGIVKVIQLATGGKMPVQLSIPELRQKEPQKFEDVILCQFDGRSGGVWPKQTILEFLRRYEGQKLVILGGPDTKSYLGDEFEYRIGDLPFLVSQLLSCKRFVGTDSGLAHLASVLGLEIDMLPSPSVGRRLVQGIFQFYDKPPQIDFSFHDRKDLGKSKVNASSKRANPVNIHVLNTPNIGDRLCSPSLYFDVAGKNHDLWQHEPSDNCPLIIGGGGLLHPSFSAKLESIVQRSRGPIIAWGVGTNTHGVQHQDHQEWLKKCHIIGLRDWEGGNHWVPCASCMSPEFDRDESPRYRAVVYRHAGEGDNIPDRMGLPTLTNYASKLSDVVTFMLSGEFVVTNTYHGMYWATLLRRKVIVYPFSSRHLFLKHRPVIMEKGRHWVLGLNEAHSYTDALEECRESNNTFATEVEQLCR